MSPSRLFSLLLLWLMYTTRDTLFLGACMGGELSETDSLINFIQAVDPKNLLRISANGSVPEPCSDQWMGVKCNLETKSITEIVLENLSLSGVIDADSLCKLPSLQVLNLAKNLIGGSIPNLISNCKSMTHLNLSSNLLQGMVPVSLSTMKNLRSLDVSNNNLSGPAPYFTQELQLLYSYTMDSRKDVNNSSVPHKLTTPSATPGSSPMESPPLPDGKESNLKRISNFFPILLVMACLFFIILVMKNRGRKEAEEKQERLKKSSAEFESPINILTAETKQDCRPEEVQSDLMFFIEEYEKFKIEELLGSAADLQGQSLFSSLYKVRLKNGNIFVVKRLKNLQVSTEEFRHTMTWVGNLKHPNLLPLVAFHSSTEDKLLIYRYQKNRSLLYLLENYADGKKDFPWQLRVSIASGIARGLNYIHRKSREKHVPHGNIKLSNILLGENEEPLISEYGFQTYIDPKRAVLYHSNGYRAPEKKLTEKADVFSFGIILLVLLTGKTFERTGINLPKWVKSMVREEWTGEVFDKEVNKVGKQWAFPLLNISLQCIAESPENRPHMGEVVDKIEEVVNGQDDYSFSSISSAESNQHDGSLLHTVIPEGSETPGSNH